MKTFQQKIAEIMGRRSITRFATDVGLPPSTLTRVMRGQEPSVAAVVAIANHAGVSTDYLLRDEMERPVAVERLTATQRVIVDLAEVVGVDRVIRVLAEAVVPTGGVRRDSKRMG